QHTNMISWVTSDAFYTPVLESSSALGSNAVWSVVTNAPVVTDLTNTVALPATDSGAQFFRLRVL
ncbi:MAG TPA: hypothetical protein VHH88_01110, partial [Verrucomicrobiae bacterium]|nr:hypothetical protein [Verrucomicrobiae bacterium]